MYSISTNISNTYINIGGDNQAKNFQLLTSDFSIDENNKIIPIIKNAVSKYSKYRDIALFIHEQCQKSFSGKWTISVGGRDNIFCHTSSDRVLGCNIGSYKIIVNYCA